MNQCRSDVNVDAINSSLIAQDRKPENTKSKKNMNNTHDANRRVHFVSVETREYPMTLGVNPATSIGAPVCLSWEYLQLPNESFKDKKSRNQSQHYPQKNKNPHSFYLNYYQRKEILERAGFKSQELKRAETSIRWDQGKRKLSEYQSFPALFVKALKVQYGGWKAKSFVRKYRKENGLKGRKKRKPNVIRKEQSKKI